MNEASSNDINPRYPASYDLPNIISVAATDELDQIASYSNYGPQTVDVAAPGGSGIRFNIYSTAPPERETIFSDDFESAGSKWLTGGIHQRWSIEFRSSFGSTVLLSSPSGYYDSYENSYVLTANPIDAQSYRGLFAELRIEFSLQDGYDFLYVEVSQDGINYTRLGFLTGFSNGVIPYYIWLNDKFQAGSFYLRLHLITDWLFNYSGVYIDDIVLTGIRWEFSGYEYGYKSGTSMAAPVVSGIAGLIWSHNPGLTHLQVKEAILNSVDRLPSLNGKVLTGGRVNAYKALLSIPYTLTVSRNGSGTITSNPGGINCGSDCSEDYANGTQVALSASPASGWNFAGWSGCDSTSGSICYVTMDSNKNVTPTFITQYSLTVSKNGSGIVTSSPSGIDCGSYCTDNYTNGTQIALTAGPVTGWSFGSWSGCDSTSGSTCYVTMNSNMNITAIFTKISYTLTVSKSGSGTVTSSPTGINCPSDCTELYVSGTEITLTASPASGWNFSGWSGCDSSSGSTCNVNINSNRTATAIFTTYTSTIKVTSISPNMGTTFGACAVTLTGSGFNSGAMPIIGSAPANNTTVVSGTLITALTPVSTAPAGNAPVPVNVMVANADGKSSDPSRDQVTFTYVHPADFRDASGNLNSDGHVSIGEVQSAINMFLTGQDVKPQMDSNCNGRISIGEVQQAINSFLGLP